MFSIIWKPSLKKPSNDSTLTLRAGSMTTSHYLANHEISIGQIVGLSAAHSGSAGTPLNSDPDVHSHFIEMHS
jgi:hypothetical protein